MLDVNIHETNKVVLALKRKKAKARTNAKKVNSKIVHQNSRLSTISTFNMIKVNRYDNRGKISRTS